MPVAVTYPGVYLEEISSGVRSISGVSTSIAAFVDAFPAGPMNKATRVLGFADFEKQFGGLSATSEASYGLQQFFLNGGSEAYVVRVTSTTAGNAAVAAAVNIADSASAPLLAVTAADEGAWGNNVRIAVDYNTIDPATQFNLIVTEVDTNNNVVATETYRNLVADPSKPNDVRAVVNAGSNLIQLSETPTGNRPGVGTYSLAGGADGVWDPAIDAAGVTGALIGQQALKTGMYALLDVDLFNILCIPATMNLPDADAFQVATDATALCTSRRAMYLLDAPNPTGGPSRDTVNGITTWLNANSALRSRNAALYFPRVDVADPLNGFRLRTVGPSGTMAGVWASTDAARGVWKAPAGIDATLAGVQKLEYKLTDLENGVVNPLAINALRTFPVYGPVSWGARTLYGADQLVDDYKYIPVRRLALFIEESLYRGTQWVVFEPNDSPLWSQIRLNVGAFMQTLFRQGAFAGSTPADAYFVNCDDKTNPQADINLGIVNVVVGFAPLKPAEFVVIQIQQMAGQIAS